MGAFNFALQLEVDGDIQASLSLTLSVQEAAQAAAGTMDRLSPSFVVAVNTVLARCTLQLTRIKSILDPAGFSLNQEAEIAGLWRAVAQAEGVNDDSGVEKLVNFIGFTFMETCGKDLACLSQAVDAYQHGLRRVPNSAELMLHLAWAYEQLGKYDDSLHLFQRIAAMESAAGDGTIIAAACLGVGNHALRNGQPNDAVVWYQRVLDNPNAGDSIRASATLNFLTTFATSVGGMEAALALVRNPRFEATNVALPSTEKLNLRMLDITVRLWPSLAQHCQCCDVMNLLTRCCRGWFSRAADAAEQLLLGGT